MNIGGPDLGGYIFLCVLRFLLQFQVENDTNLALLLEKLKREDGTTCELGGEKPAYLYWHMHRFQILDLPVLRSIKYNTVSS